MRNLRRQIPVAAFLCAAAFFHPVVGETGSGTKSRTCAFAGLFDTLPGPAWMGWSIIAAEYVAGPFVAYQYWWKDGLSRDPFSNMFESEPYLEDKTWHCWNGANLTDLHYWTLKKFFKTDSRWGAMGMTFFTLTAIELLDGSDRDRKWGTSWRDEAGNITGIMLWYLRQKFPAYFPVDIRLGVRRWDKFPSMVSSVFTDIKTSDSKHYRSTHMNNYSIFNTEIIVRPYNYFYGGLAISCKTDSMGIGIPENLFGVTTGFDVLRWYANKHRGKLTPLANLIGQNLSLPIYFTYWFGK